jgi:outer membrane protein assembly factor BamA
MVYSAAKSFRWFSFPFGFLLLLFTNACVVKNYPPKTPFVYETNIRLNGNLNNTEKKDLQVRLEEQLDDSLRVRWLRKFLVLKVLNNPPHWDSIYAERSKVFMSGALNAIGYLRDSIDYRAKIDSVEDQYRTTVNFDVLPGKLVTIDSVSFHLTSDTVPNKPLFDTLQIITEGNLTQSLIKKGEPFSRALISGEFDRLTDVYRNNGYLRFTRDDLIAVWDTVGIALLRPTLDPIEQAQQLEALRKRRENPTADIDVRLRSNVDPSHLVRYHVGKITIYPDFAPEFENQKADTVHLNDYTLISYENMFKPKVVVENMYLRRGDMYDQRNYLRTINRFNSIGSWRLVSIDQIPRPETDSVDFVVRLTPAVKYLFNASLEGSKNWGNYFADGNLLGIGVTLGLQNRNFLRGANLSNTNFRYAVELNAGGDFIQTQQVSAGQNISFPRAVPKQGFLQKPGIENLRTIFSFNIGNTDRRNFFNLTNFNTSWGYEFTKGNKLFGLRFPNIEYSFISRKSLLNDLIDSNRSYRYIFNSGLIVSGIGNISINKSKSDYTQQIRMNAEWTPFGFASGTPFLDSNLYNFAKFDVEWKRAYKVQLNNEIVFRFFGGVGWSMPRNSNDSLNRFLPFFRAYYAGGANSMRAWGLRKLGPGSTVRSFGNKEAPDRFGDMQLEGNIEYRFYIGTIAGIKLKSALFTDIGNVWTIRTQKENPDAEFRVDKLWKDLAIGVGTGLRVDLGIFIIRVDYAYKVKDPSPADVAAQNKWFYDWRLLGGQLQLGINYPF